jgi:TolA-binding protein
LLAGKQLVRQAERGRRGEEEQVMMRELQRLGRLWCTLLGGCVAALLVASAVSAQNAVAPAAAAPAAKSSPEAERIYLDGRNYQNGGAFDLAAIEWAKLVKDFPKDPLADKAQHYLGVCLLKLDKPTEAEASFQAVVKNYPKFDLMEDTLLSLGACQYAQAVAGKKDHYAAAGATFDSLLKQYPKGRYVEEALYFAGESLYAQGKKPEAVAYYERLVSEFPEGKRLADALYAQGVAQEELGKFAEAGAIYDKFLASFAQSPLATEVKMRKAETVLQAGDAATAGKMFAEVAAVKDFAAADHALFRQALCEVKQDHYAEAGALYARIPTEFPQSPSAAEATIAAGRCFHRAEKYGEASQWFDKAIAAGQSHAAEAAHWQCKILLKSGKPAEAAALAAKQLAAGGESPFLVDLALDRGDALFEIPDQRAEALAVYAKLADAQPEHALAPQARYNAAFAALDLKQYPQAIEQAAAFLKAYPQDRLVPDVTYVAAEAQLQLQNYGEAEKGYAQLLRIAQEHPDREIWQVRQGLVAYLQKKYPETTAILSPIVGQLKLPAAISEAQYLIGASQFQTEQFAEAAKSLAASLAADPKSRQAPEALLLVARVQARGGDYAAAVASAERVLKEFPESPLLDQVHYRLGEFAYAKDDFAGAAAAYDRVLKDWPESPFAPYALYGKGWSQTKSKDFAAGADSFSQLLAKYPEHALQADSLYARAMCRRQAGAAKEAITDLDAFLATIPAATRKSEALYEKGLAQVALGDQAAAATTFAAILETDPKFAATDKVLYELAWAEKSQNKFAEAAAHFARLSQEFGDSPLAAEAWFHVAESHYEKKDYAAAVKAYGQAQAKSPMSELAEKTAYKLGWAHYQQKQYDEARQAFTEQLAASGQGPLAADARFMQADCLFYLEKYAEAYAAFQVAAKEKASSPVFEVLTLLHGGQSASQLKQWTDAIAMLAAIPEKFPDTPLLAEALYELAWAKQNAGQTAEALADYEAAATKSRDQVGARARFMMGELHFAEKKYDLAIQEFRRAMLGYGGEQAAAETKNWQAKSGYEAGRCAEVQIAAASDAAQKQQFVQSARQFYTFVVEKHASHELAAEAKKRLEALKSL